MCPLPWMHLATHPEGKSTLCCISDHTNNMSAARSSGRVLNLNKNKVIEIVNSDYYVEVRDQMLNGEKPKACMRCYNEEDTNLMSKRQLELSRFGSDYHGTTIKPDLKFIELRLGNLCNVKCRTCNPASSTQWISEYNKLQQELKFVTHYNSKIDTYWTQSDEFWDDLLENSKNVELIYINGGEPTLVEKHWYYLERLIDRGLHKQVKLWYSINMTNLPDKLLDIWKQFKSVEIHGSIDDLYERNSYIRKGTNWQDVETNIHKLLENKWIDFSVTQTVSWMNVYYLNEFKQYFNNLNIPTQTNLVYDPKFYSINILPSEYKEILSSKLIGFDYILNQVSTDINISLFNQGIEYNNWLDQNRNENFNMVFTEWADTIRSSI
jgi:sulfatase maturation enzyme AslB (radical SAM superfamily)